MPRAAVNGIELYYDDTGSGYPVYAWSVFRDHLAQHALVLEFFRLVESNRWARRENVTTGMPRA